MRCRIVSLYEYFELDRPAGAVGTLTCLLPDRLEVDGCQRFLPAMLVLPGGAYAFVSRREAEPVALRYAAAGYCAFVLDYAVAPARYPVALTEAAMAMAFIRENAESLHVDAAHVSAVGFSAGGHLCACLATLFSEPVLRERLGARAVLARPDAVVLSYPVITSGQSAHRDSFLNLCGDDEALTAALSLETRVRPDSPPAFVWHTYADELVSVQNSLLFTAACAAKGVPFALHIFENGAHGLSNADETVYPFDGIPEASAGTREWFSMSLRFLYEHGFRPRDVPDRSEPDGVQ